jgi:transposase-like protein
MNIYELAMEYGHTAELLRGRIRQLEQEKKLTEDEQETLQLDGRIRPLRVMYRETRSVARHLESYYARIDPDKRRKKK